MKFILSKKKILVLIKNYKKHNPNSYFYKSFLKKHLEYINKIAGLKSSYNLNLGNFINFKLPFESFGHTNTVNLLSDIIAFIFYIKKKNFYKKVLDIGANIGLHTIIMSKLGSKVISFEPDPEHFLKLKKNIKLNNLKNVEVHNYALSNSNSTKYFVRVLNNLTGNHIINSKNKVYGPVSLIKVKVKDSAKYLEMVDFAKIDCEGQEDKIFLSLLKVKKRPDILVEIHSFKKANIIFNLCKKNNIYLFSQKNSWAVVKKLSHMPFSHKDGLLFASSNNKHPFY